MTINDFIIKWNIRFATNDTFEIDEQDFREFKDDIAAFLQAGPGGSPRLSELNLPQPVIADSLYLTGTAIWAARSSFNAVAPPMPGPNWRLVVSFAPTITAASITDASPAGRSLLTAASAPVQLGLLDVLAISKDQWGTHPAFERAYTDSGLLLFLLKGLMQLQQAVQSTQQVSAPVAPTAGQVDDQGDTFSFTPNPAYPSFSQYKVNGLPGVTGAVALDSLNSYVSGNRVYVKVVGAVAKGGLAVYVVGSGNLPDGAVLTNADPFTGVVVTPTPAATTPDAPFPSYDPVTRVLTFTHALGTSELEYNRFGGTFTGYAPIQVDDSAHSAGEWKARVRAMIGRNASGTADSPAITAKAVVNRIPVADAGQDVTIQLPTSSLALMGTATDPDPSDTLTQVWRQITGPSTATGLPATTLNVVASGLVAGTYQFGFRSTDNHGAQSVEDYVLVTVQAAAVGVDLNVLVGDSIARADQATQAAGFPVNTGTTAVQQSQDAIGNVGRQSHIEKATDLLNADYPNRYRSLVLGYPGKTCFWYERNILPKFATLDFSAYTRVNVFPAFGANCLVYPDPTHSPADSTAPADVAACIKRICLKLASYSPKIRIILCPTLNRTYTDPNTGQQDPPFVGFDDRRQALNRILLTDLSTFAVGASNIYAQAIGQAEMCFNAPNALMVDESHPNPEGQRQMGVEDARALARIDNLTLTGGNGTAPVAPAAASGPPTIPTTGYSVWQLLDGKGLVDSANARRIYKTDTADDFGGKFVANRLARTAPAATVKWQAVIRVKASAGPTQLVYLSTNKDSNHFADPGSLVSVYWNQTDYRLFQSGSGTLAGPTTVATDRVIQVVASDKIRFYLDGAQTPFATSAVAVPTADVYLFAELGGIPAGGKPEIVDVQWFPANPVAYTLGGGTTTPSTAANNELGIWWNMKNVTPRGSTGYLDKTGTDRRFDGQATLNKRIPAGSLPGTRIAIDRIVRAEITDTFLVGVSPTPHKDGIDITSLHYAIYCDPQLIRVFDNSSGSPVKVAEVSFTAAAADLAIEIDQAGYHFYDGSTLLGSIAADTTGNGFIGAVMAVIGAYVPPVRVTNSNFIAYQL